MMKKIISLLLLIAVILGIITGCSNQNVTENEEQESETVAVTSEETTQETNSDIASNQEKYASVYDLRYTERLSNNYIVLHQAIDEDGNVWELVGEDNETYQGSKITIGVIKNDEWFIELTDTCPLIVDGQIDQYKSVSAWDNSVYNHDFFYFMSGGIYICDSPMRTIFWDTVNNRQATITEKNSNVFEQDYSRRCIDNKELIYATKEYQGGLAANYKETYKFYIFYPNKCEINLVKEAVFYNTGGNLEISQLYEGLFYSNYDLDTQEKIHTFYDGNFKKVFDLNEYDTESAPLISVGHFVDGKCELINQLDSGGQFKITIDKTGKMISQEKYN